MSVIGLYIDTNLAYASYCHARLHFGSSNFALLDSRGNLRFSLPCSRSRWRTSSRFVLRVYIVLVVQILVIVWRSQFFIKLSIFLHAEPPVVKAMTKLVLIGSLRKGNKIIILMLITIIYLNTYSSRFLIEKGGISVSTQFWELLFLISFNSRSVRVAHMYSTYVHAGS